jgi:enamine deaminase RidA (YjgF/YER057c/UK114 family)
MSQIVAESSSGLIRAEIEAFAATSHTVVRCPELYAGLAPGLEWPNHAHATWVGNLLFTSGQLALGKDGSLACRSAKDQTAYVLGAIDRILQAAGQSAADLVKLTVWIAEDEDCDAVARACGRYLRERMPAGPYPALTMLVAPLGVAGARVQVEAIAARGRRIGVECPGLGSAVSPEVPHVHAVRVPLTSPVGSYLRRFSWPAGATDADRAQLGGQLEHPQALGSLVFFSSVAGVNADQRLAGTGMRAQADRVFENLRAVSEAAGGRFSDIVQFNVYFAQRSLYQEYNEARVKFVEANVPDKDWFTGSGIQAKSTLDGAWMEIEAIAAIG